MDNEHDDQIDPKIVEHLKAIDATFPGGLGAYATAFNNLTPEQIAETLRPAPHHYISTACQHGLHGRCRQECKFCGQKCSCGCGHSEQPDRFVGGLKANRHPVGCVCAECNQPAQQPIAWRYRNLIDKHLTGPPLPGQIQVGEVWGYIGSWQFSESEPFSPFLVEKYPLYAQWQPAQPISDAEVTRIYVALKSAMGEDVFTLRTEIRFIANAVLAEMGRR